MASANLVTGGFGGLKAIVLAAAILQAGAATGASTLSDADLLRQQIEWDDREVIELLQIIMQSGILK